MVDPVGFKPASLASRLTPVSPAAPVRSVEGASQAANTSAAASLTQSAAASAPVDAERVARIKKAIADGNFPLVPSTIADRLLALKLQWNPNDPA
ncbi:MULTISPECIES: flagellar biosynthesis anti-sigma factor FlgM [unclassified Sphingomonas]|uniref:flagellar biosynthesis anti-sigma factor FlgM n=1 Tax=unclassified Sphingomonas TaxID=196159 RepID=UPI002150ABB0|nr:MULTISPECIES: flagellar biosynthesis anti-sigma factor FlgM [unclassified Sphingomonas]MCR5870507.1 flagellar biosynthesis anti-sigma factor FlgM [Sphingomonas sp. J344]UUY01147.1 flagellar biosynthesis anti-sigma factor FlgM [Sphingomonas sp. J315]